MRRAPARLLCALRLVQLPSPLSGSAERATKDALHVSLQCRDVLHDYEAVCWLLTHRRILIPARVFEPA